MKQNLILAIGIIATLIFILLWYFGIIKEPIIPVCTGFLTFLGYFIAKKSKKSDSKTIIKQNHSGTGDNVAGNKITNNQ